MGKIAFYSDFDGVYNIPISSATKSATVKTNNSDFLKPESVISWNHEVVEMLIELLDTGLYDFMWHTTWNDGGNIVFAAETLGITHNKYSLSKLNNQAQGKKEWTAWKAEHIIEDQTNNPRPFIWIDDSAPDFWEDHVKGHTREKSLIIRTNGRIGLTKEDIVKIIDWTMMIRQEQQEKE